MGYLVRMPKLGLEMEEGTVTGWRVSEGEPVEAGAVIAEIESAKSAGEIEAREGGVLRRIDVEEGETVPTGAPLAIVAEADEDIGDLEADLDAEGSPEADGAEATAAGETKKEAAAGDTGGTAPAASPGEAGTPSAGTATAESVKASPRARDRAEDLGVDLTTVEGTGPGGAITEDDVESATETTAAGAAAPPAGATLDGDAVEPAPRTVTEEVEFGGMRRTIAERLSQSAHDAVHVTEHRTVDAEELLEATEAADATLDTDVSINDVLLRAISATLSEHPGFNATYEDEVHTIYREHNIGIAVDIEAGLIAPVLPAVNEKSLAEIGEGRRTLTERAQSGEYTMDDLAGGTFTVTNLGVLGVEAFDPIINPPQVAILGIDALTERPVRTERGMEFRRMLPFSLSFDHRVVDGADAARFLATLAEHVEDPWPLLPEAVDGSVRDGAAGSRRQATVISAEGPEGVVEAGAMAWEWGGDAPSPVHLFLGSLAACLGYYATVHADGAVVDLGEIAVTAGTPGDHGAIERVETLLAAAVPPERSGLLSDIATNAEADCLVSRALRSDLEVSLGTADTATLELERTATARTVDGTTGTVESEGHTWEYAGDATPVQAFLGSIGACLTYFLRQRADGADVAVGRIRFEARTPGTGGDIEAIELEAGLETDAAEDVVTGLLEGAIADCVVEDLVTPMIPIDVSWEWL